MDKYQHIYDKAYSVLRGLYDDAEMYIDNLQTSIERWCFNQRGEICGGELFMLAEGYDEDTGDVCIYLDSYAGTITARYENEDMQVVVIIPDSINKAARKAFEYNAYAMGAIPALAETINPAW